jgi:hypothetical protein
MLLWGARDGTAKQSLISPGPLARAHAALDGVGNCAKCHDAGHELSPEKCLSCHKPIADRMARKTGVHRNVTGDCRQCHVEHRGKDADLRRIDPQSFNHAAETGYPIEHLHARLAATCAACHKTRSFLVARPSCDACHKDVHNPTLGADCTRCHATDQAFKTTRQRFDHAKAQFRLTGAHRQVACEKCHVAGRFRGLHFDACSACHKTPHRRELAPACTSCHVTDAWKTRTVDHARTGFALAGAHARVACASCHKTGVKVALRFDQCAACHSDVHRASVKGDCRSCHTETGFTPATFDHAARTGFPLVGRHEPLACRKCHAGITADNVPLARKVVDFSGTAPACVSCHKDEHRGDFGRACDACHRSDTFKVAGFTHPRSPEFFAGRHTGVACVKCHMRPSVAGGAKPATAGLALRATNPAQTCSTCHADPHLGQLGPACDRCHTIDAPKFAASRFAHEKTTFPLSGRHGTLACVKCHPAETRVFPAGAGTATRLAATPTECQACHKDPHLGQADRACTACHTTSSFRLLAYTHRGMDDFFGGFHGRLPCASCHKTETGQFPTGRGTAVRLKLGRTCAACHPYN